MAQGWRGRWEVRGHPCDCGVVLQECHYGLPASGNDRLRGHPMAVCCAGTPPNCIGSHLLQHPTGEPAVGPRCLDGYGQQDLET